MLRHLSVQPSLSRILLVDDDLQLVYFIRVLLEKEGYRVIEAKNGEIGLEFALKDRPDLVVLDVDMPRLSGIKVCQELRRLHFESPILMLTGSGRVDQKVAGLDAGADDYLAKPFDPREFLARVQALLRRRKREELQHITLRLGDVEVDLGRKTAARDGEPVALTKTEYALLDVLAKNMDQPVSRETILDVVWGYTRFPNTRTVDTHVWRLRKKLGPTGEKCIQRIHGQGYLLSGSAQTPQATETRDDDKAFPHVA